MSQAGYTPISLYYSTTAAAVPTSGNLVAGELAINTLDGKLYYKNSAGTVTLLASSTTVTNSFSAGTTGLTPNTATTGAVTLAGTLVVGNGGTGQTTLATGALGYGQGTSAHASLAIGTAGQILTVNSGATAPQWSTLSGVAVTTFSAGTTGFTPSTATSGAVTLAGTLATTNGGTGLTSFTSGGVVYASSSSALATGSALTFDGSQLGVGTASGTSNGLKLNSGNAGANYVFYRASATGLLTIYGNQTGFNGLTVTGIDGDLATLTSTGLGIGTNSPNSKIDAYYAATPIGATTWGTAATLRAGTGTFALTGANNRGIGTLVHTNQNTNTTLPYGGSYEVFGLISAANSAVGGGYGVYGVSAYSRSDGIAYAIRADAINTTGTPGTATYGLYVGSVTGGANNYGVYVNDTSASNYFGGKVGIGTSNPSQKFVVYEASTTAYSITETGAAGAYAIILAKNPNNDLYLWNRGDNNTSLLVSTAWDLIISANAAKYVGFQTNGSERARFASDGKFSINTTSSGAYTQVNTYGGPNVVAYRVFDGNHDASSSTFIYPITAYYARRDNVQRFSNPIVTDVSNGAGATAVIAFTDRPGTAGYPTFVRTSDILFYTATNDGNAGIDANPRLTMQIYAEGTIQFNRYGAGTLSTNASGVVSASDGRMKTKTRDLTEGLSKIRALAKTTMYYLWNENTPMRSEHEEIGWAAQDVAAVIPEASPDPGQDKFRNYHDRAVIAYMAKAIDELAAQIESLKTA